MRVLIALNHELLRYGLIQLLKDIQPMEYMVTAPTVEELIEAIKKYDFDLIVLDVTMMGRGERRNVLLLQDMPRSAKIVLMINNTLSEQNISDFINTHEIMGVFHEHSPLEDLMGFFQRVLNGERVHLVGAQREESSFKRERTEDILSKREEEVLYMKVQGYTVKETAELLRISEKTVENHRRNIRKKLEIHKNSEWIEWGKKLGMI
ncbi:response regulator transcription factor [Evansella tamaricis]|uniref:Response regulator transcription factor n=1 Tax=Evansella tamaricis TaxID=2069301 RepID=A0ABS6JLR7_9BACI|nr:response regulator transcription factor [Evansella tamaricis]MBU9714598.1 response regulator transcription factor [Evansella tamaricis]